ncbi:hypothetical protein E2C01_048032 [Portunus trituberculatus]|uniref:Uncharacterized protein n=1 Tax=Portunus trituberculatus TaxID=210409 RepID=A0A5B7G9M2_PORTR|nr:hypothetical protein [Portunus trituberculatus]
MTGLVLAFSFYFVLQVVRIIVPFVSPEEFTKTPQEATAAAAGPRPALCAYIKNVGGVSDFRLFSLLPSKRQWRRGEAGLLLMLLAERGSAALSSVEQCQGAAVVELVATPCGRHANPTMTRWCVMPVSDPPSGRGCGAAWTRRGSS